MQATKTRTRDAQSTKARIPAAAIGYDDLTQRVSGEILSKRAFMTEKALDIRLAFNIDTIMRLVAL